MIFITGGARSGKSSFAEELACGKGKEVTYIATAAAGDDEMHARITEHRRRRPGSWKTVEAQADLPAALEKALEEEGTVLVDCLTVYIANLLQRHDAGGKAVPLESVNEEVERLSEVCRSGNGRVILVSNEVGMGIVPDNELARTFRDAAGRANQKLAASADEVYMCVSGIPMKVK